MQVVVTKENQLGILNLIVFVLSVYVLLAILVDTIFVLPVETSILLNYIDNAICVFFFIEFCVRFFQAEGYGDKFPVTTEGRCIAAILMTAGVGLFGTFTAYVASWFVTERK